MMDRIHVTQQWQAAPNPKRKVPNEARTRPLLPATACVRKSPFHPVCFFVLIQFARSISAYFTLHIESCSQLITLMALQLANRAGALRRLHLGDIPSRVFTVQNQLRQLSLSSQPRLITPKAGVLSTTISQNATFATQATKPKKPKTTTKATKKPKTTKTTKKRELTDKQKEAKALREERDLKKKLKETALTTPKKLPATAYQLAIQSTMAEARAASGGAKQTEAFQKAVQLTKAIPSYEMSVSGTAFRRQFRGRDPAPY